jgi:hypothetical protein
MSNVNDGVRKMPLSKWIALVFTVFVCVMVALDVTPWCELTNNAVEILKWLGSTIITVYFGKSAYEHKVNKEAEQKKEKDDSS